MCHIRKQWARSNLRSMISGSSLYTRDPKQIFLKITLLLSNSHTYLLSNKKKKKGAWPESEVLCCVYHCHQCKRFTEHVTKWEHINNFSTRNGVALNICQKFTIRWKWSISVPKLLYKTECSSSAPPQRVIHVCASKSATKIEDFVYVRNAFTELWIKKQGKRDRFVCGYLCEMQNVVCIPM